jgi:hypothetical protein
MPLRGTRARRLTSVSLSTEPLAPTETKGKVMRQDIFDKAYEVYQAKGQVGVIMWVDSAPAELEHTFVYWMHCDPCDCHESPSINDGESDDILCLVCTHKVGEMLFDPDAL